VSIQRVLNIGDELISINLKNIELLTFNEQLELIKNGVRPILLCFVAAS
jgi:hypothetical protein